MPSPLQIRACVPFKNSNHSPRILPPVLEENEFPSFKQFLNLRFMYSSTSVGQPIAGSTKGASESRWQEAYRNVLPKKRTLISFRFNKKRTGEEFCEMFFNERKTG
jgi:hypothetical protein